MKIKNVLSASALVSSLVSGLFITAPVIAEGNTNPVDDQEIKACGFSNAPIPKEGEAILLEDNSTVIQSTNAGSTINVNKTFSIRIQDVGGSCVSSAKVQVTGSYYFDGGTASISNVNLNASLSSVPALWTVSITGQTPIVNMTSLTLRVSYRSYVNDPYSCLVGGGYWYSAADLSIR